jgi:small conductance mechanosensitive channel
LRDGEILKRLQNILDATNWFIDPQVLVEEGVVFLSGQAESEELKKGAGLSGSQALRSAAQRVSDQ